MADLSDVIDSLRREVNPPGEDLFPNATDDDYLGNLQDSFWETMLDGLVNSSAYTEEDGIVSPVSPNTTEFSRELLQLVVFYAGIRIIRNYIMNANTKFRAKAGPVEYEADKSATTLRDVLAELTRKRNLLLTRLSDVGVTNSYYVDAVLARDESMAYGDTPFVSATSRRIEGGFGRTY